MNKPRTIGILSISALFLLLFLPIFARVILVGNQTQYNESYKIIAMCGNKRLLLFCLLAALVLLFLYHLLRRIPSNSYTMIGTVSFSALFCIAMYFIKEWMSKCIAFYGGWDCGMVANSARWVYEGGSLGYDNYYNLYTNNLPITWLLYKLYGLAEESATYPYNSEFIWIQFQCLMFSLAVFAASMLALVVTKRIADSMMTLLLCGATLLLSPWNIIPYTDGSTIVFPVLVFLLYALFRQSQSKVRMLLWPCIAFCGFFAGVMKATCTITLLAILIVEFAWIVTEKEECRKKIQKLLLQGGILVVAFLLTALCKKGMYRELGFTYLPDLEMTWSNYLYIGLVEETTGASSSYGYELAQEYVDATREERRAEELSRIAESIQEKGIGGLLDFWGRKQVMNYNDGTFSWYQEGFFQAWEYEDLTDSPAKEALRNFYWQDGDNYSLFLTLSQGIWLFVLGGVTLEGALLFLSSIAAMRKHKNAAADAVAAAPPLRLTGIIIFLGMFLFVMLFEGRARYLYNTVPVFAAMAGMALGSFYEKCANALFRGTM